MLTGTQIVISFGHWSRLPQHICENAENITVVVKYIARLRCSLKTLVVDFRLHDPTQAQNDFWTIDIDIDGTEFAVANIAHSVELSKALAKLEVKNQIKIAIDSNNEDNCKDLANLVNKIGHLKHWEPELIEGGADMDQIKDEDEVEEDDSVEEGPSSINDDGNGQLSDANVSGLDSDSPRDSEESPSDEAGIDDDIFGVNDDGNGQLSDPNVSGLDSDTPRNSQESPSDEAEVDDDIFDEESFESWVSDGTRYRWIWTLKPATAANENNQPPRC
ncbi:hypothetical protein G7Y79_00004g014990 [Physcia stellaris]|nr:hypothetical protein G7Y79_00004g014990 [Physcia stellaris]